MNKVPDAATLKYTEMLDRMPYLARDAVFKKLAEIADVRALTREEFEEHKEAVNIMRDYFSIYKSAWDKGMAAGIIMAARKLLLAGYAPEQLAKVLDLDPAEVRKLQN